MQRFKKVSIFTPTRLVSHCFDKKHPRYQWPLVCAKCNLRPTMIVTNVLRLGYFMLSVFL